MKKIISLLLALVMVMGLSVTAFAVENEATTGVPATSDAAITADYETGTAVYKSTYKVTVAWEREGTLRYTDAAKVYQWNTDKLTYEEKTGETTDTVWTVDKAAVKITVTNYSDKGITATCNEPVKAATITTLEGSYANNATTATLSLDGAYVRNGTSAATKDSTTYSITNVAGSITETNTTIGTITVSLATA